MGAWLMKLSSANWDSIPVSVWTGWGEPHGASLSQESRCPYTDSNTQPTEYDSRELLLCRPSRCLWRNCVLLCSLFYSVHPATLEPRQVETHEEVNGLQITLCLWSVLNTWGRTRRRRSNGHYKNCVITHKAIWPLEFVGVNVTALARTTNSCKL